MTRIEKMKLLNELLESEEKNDIGNLTSSDRAEFQIWVKEALEQEPKTVLYSGDGYADGYMVYDMAECPNCGYEYEEGDKDWKEPFCPHCGQALEWESEG